MFEKQLANMKILMVIAPDQFRDEELLTPKKRFQEAGAVVTVAACKLGEAKGMLGCKVHPDILITDANTKDYDAVVVIGGMGSPEYLWRDTTLHALLQQMSKNGKVVAGICLSGVVLANAGILNGKRATVWPTADSKEAFQDRRVIYIDQPVVQDGNIITANGPAAAAQFADAITAELSKISVW